MGAHQAVLLTSSQSVHLRRRVLSLRIAPVSPLFSALAKSAQPSHSTQLSFPLFSCTYELFCTGEKATPFPLCASALFAKNTPGGGGPCLTIISLSERSEEHTSELQSQSNLVCRLLLEKKN